MPRDKEYLLDILESARIAIGYLGAKTKMEFAADMECQDAIMRRLEIIGEAAGRIPEQAKVMLPQIPWNEMKSMRNFIIHEYDGVDPNVIWETLKKDIPVLIATLEKALPKT